MSIGFAFLEIVKSIKKSTRKNGGILLSFWAKIRITYVRSDVYFYILPIYSYISEKSFQKDSYMSQYIEPTILDLNKENFKIDVPNEIVKMGNPKSIWYTSEDFDTTHTKVIDRDDK